MRSSSRHSIGLLAALSLLLALAGGAYSHDGDEVRVAKSCATSATARLRLRARDSTIRVDFELSSRRPGVLWSLLVLHERRIIFRGSLRTGADGDLEVRRTVDDWYGPQTISVRARSASGNVCSVTATI